MEPQQLIQRRVMALVVVPLAIVALLGVILLLPPEQGSQEIRALIAVVGLLVAVSWTTALAIGLIRSAGGQEDTEDLSRLDARRQRMAAESDGPGSGPDPALRSTEAVDAPSSDRPTPDRRVDVVGVAPDMVTARAHQIQDLLDVQVDRLDRLEQGEQLPGHLSELFEVDHLAIRAWRMAADLLVLAESGPPDYTGVPVALETTTRLALGQVEHYRRVEVSHLGEDELPTEAARDLAQLAAILLDAVGAHDPEGVLTVETVSDEPADGAGPVTVDGFTLLLDGGRLSPADRESWNAALEAPPSVGRTDAEVDRVVAGRLARRLGCVVTIAPADDTPSVDAWDTAADNGELDDDRGAATAVLVQIEVPGTPGRARRPTSSAEDRNGDSTARPNSVLEQLMGLAPVPGAASPPEPASASAADHPTDDTDAVQALDRSTDTLPDAESDAEPDAERDTEPDARPGTESASELDPSDDPADSRPEASDDPADDQPEASDDPGDDPDGLTSTGPRPEPSVAFPFEPGPDYTAPPPVRSDPGAIPTARPGLLRDALPSGPEFELGVESLLSGGDPEPAPSAVGPDQWTLEAEPSRPAGPTAPVPPALAPPTPAPGPPVSPMPQPEPAARPPAAAVPPLLPPIETSRSTTSSQPELARPDSAQRGTDQRETAQARAEALRERLSTFRAGVDDGREAGRDVAATETANPAEDPARPSLDLSWPTFDDPPPRGPGAS